MIQRVPTPTPQTQPSACEDASTFVTSQRRMQAVFMLRELALDDRIDQMRKAKSDNFFPHSHAVLFRDPPRRQVLWTNQRNEPLDRKMSESEITTSADCFRSQSLPPEIAAHVVGDLDFVRTLDVLNHQPAVAD